MIASKGAPLITTPRFVLWIPTRSHVQTLKLPGDLPLHDEVLCEHFCSNRAIDALKTTISLGFLEVLERSHEYPWKKSARSLAMQSREPLHGPILHLSMIALSIEYNEYQKEVWPLQPCERIVTRDVMPVPVTAYRIR
jgi:hypothetical protein